MSKFAFSKYDSFPYVVGHKVKDKPDKTHYEKGVHEMENAKGYYIKPFKLVSVQEGEKIQAELNKIKEQHEEMIKAVNDLMEAKVNKIFPNLIRRN